MTTQHDETRIQFGARQTTDAFTTTTDQSLSSSNPKVHLDPRAFAPSDDKGSFGDNVTEGKFEMPLEDMLSDTKITSSTLEVHRNGGV